MKLILSLIRCYRPASAERVTLRILSFTPRRWTESSSRSPEDSFNTMAIVPLTRSSQLLSLTDSALVLQVKSSDAIDDNIVIACNWASAHDISTSFREVVLMPSQSGTVRLLIGIQ